MPRTRTQLVNKALSLLQEEGAGQSIAAEDSELCDAAVDPIVAELAAAGVVTIGNIDEIDEAIFLPLARILMNEIGEDFGRPTDPAFRLECEARIRRVVAVGPLYVPLQADYF